MFVMPRVLWFILACLLYGKQRLPEKTLINTPSLNNILYPTFFPSIISDRTSIGTGKTMVLLFSADMLLRVWRYRNWSVNAILNQISYSKYKITWSAAGLSIITSAACFKALLALCSPSAAITFARAFLAASASAAIARCRFSGTRTSLTSTLSTRTPHGSVASSSPDYIAEYNFNDLFYFFTCISCAIASLSARMSPRFLVPNTFLKVVAASSCADPL